MRPPLIEETVNFSGDFQKYVDHFSLFERFGSFYQTPKNYQKSSEMRKRCLEISRVYREFKDRWRLDLDHI